MTRQPPEGNDNADWGRTAETAACERWPLERISGDVDEPWWHDARTVEWVGEADDVFGAVAPGTPVEVKSARWRIDANGGDRRGRWLLRERAHGQLLDEAGEYALAVVREGEGVVAITLRPAWFVDELVTAWSPAKARSRDPGGNGRGRRVAQIPWGRVFEEDGEAICIAGDGVSDKGGATS